MTCCEFLEGTGPILIQAGTEKTQGTTMAQIGHAQGTEHYKKTLTTIGLFVPFSVF